MKNGKNFSEDVRNMIITKHKKGLGYRKISSQLNIPISTIGAIIRKWKNCGTTRDRQRTGRPQKINQTSGRRIVRKAKKNPFVTRRELQEDLRQAGIEVSKDTISRSLHRQGLNCRSPRKTPLLKRKHVNARLKFVDVYQNKPSEFWEKVLWSDETKIELFGGNISTHVWRKTGDAHKPSNTIPTVKFGGGSIMVWGCFAS